MERNQFEIKGKSKLKISINLMMGLKIKLKQILPREHGAWAMLFVPILIGLSIVEWSLDIGLICFLMILLFIAHHPINTYIKQKINRKNKQLLVIGLSFYLLIILGGVYLLFNYQSLQFVLLCCLAMLTFVFHLFLSYKKKELSTVNELIGIVGLTVSAPLLYVMNENRLDFIAYYVWGVNFVYFASTVFYIKLRVRLLPKVNRQLSLFDKLMLGKYSILSLIIPMLFSGIFLNTIILIPLIPPLIKVIICLVNWTPSTKLNIKHIGYLEIVLSILFLILTPLVIRTLH